jgi:hypothetical protein
LLFFFNKKTPLFSTLFFWFHFSFFRTSEFFFFLPSRAAKTKDVKTHHHKMNNVFLTKSFPTGTDTRFQAAVWTEATPKSCLDDRFWSDVPRTARTTTKREETRRTRNKKTNLHALLFGDDERSLSEQGHGTNVGSSIHQHLHKCSDLPLFQAHHACLDDGVVSKKHGVMNGTPLIVRLGLNVSSGLDQSLQEKAMRRINTNTKRTKGKEKNQKRSKGNEKNQPNAHTKRTKRESTQRTHQKDQKATRRIDPTHTHKKNKTRINPTPKEENNFFVSPRRRRKRPRIRRTGRQDAALF